MQENILIFFSSISNSVLDGLFTGITMLGEKYFLLAIALYIFWNISKKQGFIVCYIFIISMVTNSLLKLGFGIKRPFQVIEEISGKRIDTATGSSFPSGHTQGASTLFISLSMIIKRPWFYIAAVIISILVGISRIYLGVHWPLDVITGFVLGIIIPLALYKPIYNLYENKKTLYSLNLLLIIFLLLSTLILYIINSLYSESSLYLNDYFKISSFSAGASAGFILEEETCSFSTDNTLAIKITRFIAGFGTSLLIMTGLKLVLNSSLISIVIRYLLTGFWITFGFPYIGCRINLFKYEKS